MSQPLIELSEINIVNNPINSQDFYQDSPNFSNISSISQSEFSEKFHFLCNRCKRVPILRFTTKNKIIFICNCKSSYRHLSIIEIYNYLYNIQENCFEEEKLNCYIHPETKYSFYCEDCKKNLCSKCFDNCIELKHKIKSLALDLDTFYKCKYIFEKIKEGKRYIEDIEDNAGFEYESENIINTNTKPIYKKENKFIIKNKQDLNSNANFILKKEKEKNIINETENEFLNIINENSEEDYNFINLFLIIFNDYKNYPNFNHIETISNMEKLNIIVFSDYTEIKLKYRIDKENIDNNSVGLFGKKFVENNKDKSFLVINEKIINLHKSVKLSYIFDELKLLNNFPNFMDVKLIIKKTQEITDLSFMFCEVSTIFDINFDNYNTKNITKMNNMFQGCSSLIELPDISNMDITNVTDISYKLDNCSSMIGLSDISKWNTKNIINTSNMFKNCKSLSYLPDISKWKTNNIKHMNNMFENCESLERLPEISNWCINRDTDSDDMFQGCVLLEVNLQKNKPKCFKFLKCLKKLTNSIICEFSNCCCCCCVIIYIATLLFCNVYYFTLLSNSFNCEKTSEGIINPIEYFNLTQNYNISHIISFHNYSDSALNKMISEDPEKYINFIINSVQYINDITYGKAQTYYKLYSCLIFVINLLNIIINIICICKCLGLKKSIIILTILFALDFLSLLLEILNYILINKLSKFLKSYYGYILFVFLSNVPDENFSELIDLEDSKTDIFVIFLITFLSFAEIPLLCKFFLNKKRVFSLNSYDDYLLNINENYHLDEIN